MSYERAARSRPSRRTAAPAKIVIAIVVSVLVVIALFAAGIAAEQAQRGKLDAAAGTPVTAARQPVKKAKPSPPPPGIGDPVRDGKFEFVVTAVDCTRTNFGIEHVKRTAEGRFCVVSLSVRNIADEPKYFLGLAQRAQDTGGAEYGYDEIAGVYANRNTRTFLEKLDPGERVSGKLVFDIPRKAELATLILHDFPLSGGVTVTL